MPIPIGVRPAGSTDASELRALIDYEFFTHRHLDWCHPLDWIGIPPFWLIESGKHIIAALACQEDPPGVAWVRLFTATADLEISEAWETLFAKVNEHYQHKPVTCVSLSFTDWYSHLLEENRFDHVEDIVVLERKETRSLKHELKSGISIMPMRDNDLDAVCEIDHMAFAQLWNLSHNSFRRTFHDSFIASVAKFEEQVVGYQITSRTYQGAHLARLAVAPNAQKKGLGSELVIDVINQLNRMGIYHITVNTQSTNRASLAVYHHLGFKETGETIPVYLSSIPQTV